MSDLLGGLVSGAAQIVGNVMTNNANQQIAQGANATQIELANTSHQREVADLKAAGLNPVLSAGGSGSATPVQQIIPYKSPMEQVDFPTAMKAFTENDVLKQNAATAKSVEDLNKETKEKVSAEKKKAQSDAEYADFENKYYQKLGIPKIADKNVKVVGEAAKTVSNVVSSAKKANDNFLKKIFKIEDKK